MHIVPSWPLTSGTLPLVEATLRDLCSDYVLVLFLCDDVNENQSNIALLK